MISPKKCLDIVRELLTEEAFEKMAQGAIDDAIGGDLKAREWLSKYILPAKPEEAVGDESILVVNFRLVNDEDRAKAQKMYEDIDRDA